MGRGVKLVATVGTPHRCDTGSLIALPKPGMVITCLDCGQLWIYRSDHVDGFTFDIIPAGWCRTSNREVAKIKRARRREHRRIQRHQQGRAAA